MTEYRLIQEILVRLRLLRKLVSVDPLTGEYDPIHAFTRPYTLALDGLAFDLERTIDQ